MNGTGAAEADGAMTGGAMTGGAMTDGQTTDGPVPGPVGAPAGGRPGGATVSTEQARQFLAAVGAACADLPASDRARLLGGLDEHLAELAADGVDLVGELGDPASYARELRSAAGFPPGAHALGGAAAGAGGPSTLALPIGPPTTAMPLGVPHQGVGPGAPGRTGPSTGKVLLVVGAVLAGVAVLVTAAVVLGGVMLFGVSTSSTVSPVATAPAPATDVVIVVPDVVGMTADEARATLEQAGLVTGSLRISSTPKPAGSGGNVVVAQDPPAGSGAAPGTTVSLVITTG